MPNWHIEWGGHSAPKIVPINAGETVDTMTETGYSKQYRMRKEKSWLVLLEY